MKVIVDIPNWLYNAMMECKEPQYSRSLGDAVRDGTPLPKRTTNGDIIKKLFPNTTIEERCLIGIPEEANLYRVHGLDGVTDFTAEWWNTPYNENKD